MGARLLVRSGWASRSEGDAVYEFDQPRITIGRGRGADVRLPHRAVSIRHATIEHGGTGYVIVDHGTTNGTAVEGNRIVPGRPKPLRDGDRIDIGGFALVFQANVLVSKLTSSERTASLARRLARESLDASGEAPRPTVTVLNGPSEGHVLVLPDPPARLTIGRDEGCDLPLNDADLSREHAELEVGLDGVWVRDLSSKNGVFLRGRQIDERLLDDRDEIRLGSTVLRFEDPVEAAVEARGEGDDEEVETPVYEPPAPEPVTEPEPVTPPEPPPPRAASRHRSVAAADVVIYVLASVVFALSLLGLFWLLRSG